MGDEDVNSAGVDLPYFSYAAPEDPSLKRFCIQAIETLTGQRRLKQLYLEYRRTAASGSGADEDFWQAAIEKLELDLAYDLQAFQRIPSDGPLVVVCNHPFGVLDGIVICYLMSRARPNFKVLTNSVLYRAPEIRPYVLPIDFAETREALAINLATRRAAMEELRADGAVVVFPAGGVATTPGLFAPIAVDDEWKSFVGKLIKQSKSTVVPIFFEGQNSRLFQIVSQFSLMLRVSLLFKEVADRIGTRMDIRIGEAIDFSDLAHLTDRQALMDHLREITMALRRGDG